MEEVGGKVFVDLSHTVEAGMITYKGLPAPIICDFLSREESRKYYAEGCEFNIGKIEMVANTGTYVDSPFHRYPTGKDLSELSLSSLADLPGELIHIDTSRVGRAIPASVFEGRQLEGKAVIVHTGWSQHWRTDQYFEGHPFLTEEAVKYLVSQRVKLVGIDSYNIDDTADLRRPAHSTLLGNDIPIAEHLCNLSSIPDHRPFSFFAVPAKVKAFGTFPVRAFALLK